MTDNSIKKKKTNNIDVVFIIRLQDILSTKKKILRENKTDFKAKVPLLQDEIEKLKQDIERHEKKVERFAEIQEKTYKELWDFSQEQINIHLEKVIFLSFFLSNLYIFIINNN